MSSGRRRHRSIERRPRQPLGRDRPPSRIRSPNRSIRRLRRSPRCAAPSCCARRCRARWRCCRRGRSPSRARRRASRLEPTPPDAEGPFYPTRIPAEADADLTRVAGRAARAKGTPLELAGRVLRPTASRSPARRSSCGNATCSARYHHVGGGGGRRDENFQGYGVADRRMPTALRVHDDPARCPTAAARRICTSSSRTRARAAHDADLLHGRIGRTRASGFGMSGRDARSRLRVRAGAGSGREADALAATIRLRAR